MVKFGGWRGAGAPDRPEPTTAIVRRGEDGWGRGATGPAKLDHYLALSDPPKFVGGESKH